MLLSSASQSSQKVYDDLRWFRAAMVKAIQLDTRLTMLTREKAS